MIGQLHKEIDLTFDRYINLLVGYYDLDKEELLEILHKDGQPLGKSGQSKTTKKKDSTVESLTQVDMTDLSPERLNKCKVEELKALCREHGHKVSGKKQELVDRLLGKDNSDAKSREKSEEKSKRGKTESKTKAAKSSQDSSIVRKLTSNIPAIAIRPNKFKNLEHPETGLVFDKKTETVIGKQLDDGTVAELEDEDIENCKRFKFTYKIPDNLEKKTTLDEVHVDELDDDEILDDSDSEIELIEDKNDEVDIDEIDLEEDDDEDVEIEDD